MVVAGATSAAVMNVSVYMQFSFKFDWGHSENDMSLKITAPDRYRRSSSARRLSAAMQ